MSCEDNSEEVKLAGEYKYLLSNIRPLIEQLDKSKDVQQCLLWLSKLHECSRNEGYQRNEILSELSRQVKNKCLEPPFNSQPPSGPLKYITLRKSTPFCGSYDFSDDKSSDITTETSLQSPLSRFSNRSMGKNCCEFRRMPLNKFSHKTPNCCKTLKELKEDHTRYLALQQKYHERVLNDQLLITRYQEIIKSLISRKSKNAGSVKMKSLKSSYENKICELTSSLKVVEEENKNLKQKMLTNVQGEKLQELEVTNMKLKEKIKQLEVEKNALELKCRNLENEKEAAVYELSSKLNESEKRVKEMDNHVKTIEKKCDEKFRTYQAEHQEEMNDLEKKYTCELSLLERILEEKQNKIGTLMEQVSTQSLHFEAEVLRLKHDLLQNPELDKERRKVKFLKNKVKNLEKLQENMATAFQSQLEQLIARRDLLISTLEMKLNSRDCEKFGNALQPGLDNFSDKVCILEAQYRKLLEESENQAIQRRQIDLQKILTLEKQLVDHGVGVQDLSPVSYQENPMLTRSNRSVECFGSKDEKLN